MKNFHRITIPRSAHYYTLGEATRKVKHLWLVCHGYGQTAEEFIENFEGIADEETLVVAPEGLNKFYWNGFGGKPVATWMTSLHRSDEIADFSHYLNSLFHHFVSECADNVEVTLLGFSQGCATQARFIMDKFPDFTNFVICGGGIPEDLAYGNHSDYWEDKNLYFLCGDNDKFITPALIDKHENFLHSQGLSWEKIIFEGKHELKEIPLLAIKQSIALHKIVTFATR